ncbi:MAG: hypothetical protein RLY40_1387 [Pseudomonadota bacterium]|jgi:hypothetical protein
MNLANESYDEVYLKYKKNPDLEKFNICRINFSQIKSIIESKTNSTSLINKLYIEAWISTLYSVKHALNLEPETEEQLNVLSQKIQKIGREFKKLLEKKSSIDSNDKNYTRLLKYIDDFALFWKTDEKKLLADATFNFAETLIEHKNFSQVLYHFETAKNLYADAATHHAPDSANNKMLLEFSEQTNDRLQEIKNQHPETDPNKLIKELRICLQKLPDSSIWTVVNGSEKKTQIVGQFTEIDSPTSKLKRKLNETDPSIACPKKVKLRWKIECEQLLKEFNLIGMNYNHNEANISQKSLDRIKCSGSNLM